MVATLDTKLQKQIHEIDTKLYALMLEVYDTTGISIKSLPTPDGLSGVNHLMIFTLFHIYPALHELSEQGSPIAPGILTRSLVELMGTIAWLNKDKEGADSKIQELTRRGIQLDELMQIDGTRTRIDALPITNKDRIEFFGEAWSIWYAFLTSYSHLDAGFYAASGKWWDDLHVIRLIYIVTTCNILTMTLDHVQNNAVLLIRLNETKEMLMDAIRKNPRLGEMLPDDFFLFYEK